MEYNEFCVTYSKIWSRYLQKVNDDIERNYISFGQGKLLFPNIVLYIETPEHYIAELFGATSGFQGLEERRGKATSTNKYLYQFNEDSNNPGMKIETQNSGFYGMLLSRKVDLEKVKSRFGFDSPIGDYAHLEFIGGSGSLFSFYKEFETCYLDTCLIINNLGDIYHAKEILHLTIVSKNISLEKCIQMESNCFKWPVAYSSQLRGIHFVADGKTDRNRLSGQFTNLYLTPELRETTIGKFLHYNQNILKHALKCSEILYEKPFVWVAGNLPSSSDFIKPDFMLKSGVTHYWDICDLKLPLFDKSKVTKGGFERRRFIDAVYEGIAQLSTYETYFSIEQNAQYAREKYGIEVNNPRLILIVGNYENAVPEEIEQAASALKPNYMIIDYDSLNLAYLKNSK